MSETTDVVFPALKALSALEVLCWRNNSGALYESYPVMRGGAQVRIDGQPVYFRGRLIHFGLEGSPDIIGFCRICGTFVGPEAKTLRGPAIAAEFKTLVADYIEQRYARKDRPAAE